MYCWRGGKTRARHRKGREGCMKRLFFSGGVAAAGSVTITAAIEGQSGTSAVRSIPVSVAAVSVKPTPDSVAVGKTVTLKATPTRANGDTLTAKKMFWASSDTSVAIVSSNDSL